MSVTYQWRAEKPLKWVLIFFAFFPSGFEQKRDYSQSMSSTKKIAENMYVNLGTKIQSQSPTTHPFA